MNFVAALLNVMFIINLTNAKLHIKTLLHFVPLLGFLAYILKTITCSFYRIRHSRLI